MVVEPCEVLKEINKALDDIQRVLSAYLQTNVTLHTITRDEVFIYAHFVSPDKTLKINRTSTFNTDYTTAVLVDYGSKGPVGVELYPY